MLILGLWAMLLEGDKIPDFKETVFQGAAKFAIFENEFS